MPPSLARRRRPLGAILVAYGLVGLLISGTATWAAVATATRVEPAAERLDATRDSIVASLDAAAVALDRAAQAAATAESGLDAAASTTQRTAGLLRDLADGAAGLGLAAGSISFLGQTPFAGLAEPLGQLGASARDLAADADRLAASLASLAGQAPAIADGLDVLGTRLEHVGGRLDGLGLDEALVSSTRVLAGAAALLFAWLAMIALAALVAGAWLLRWREPPGPEAEPAAAAVAAH